MRCFFHSLNFPFSFLYIPVLVKYNVPILQRSKPMGTGCKPQKRRARQSHGRGLHTLPRQPQTKIVGKMTENWQKVADLITANIISTTKAVLTVDEAARYMGIAKSTLYKMMMRREIPYSKPNGKVCFFDRQELEAWLMSNRVATSDEIRDKAQAYCAHTRTNKTKGGAI